MVDQLLISAVIRQTQKAPASTAAYPRAKSASDALSEVPLEKHIQILFHFQIVETIMNYE